MDHCIAIARASRGIPRTHIPCAPDSVPAAAEEVRTVCGSSVYIRLSNDVIALQRTNGGAAKRTASGSLPWL